MSEENTQCNYCNGSGFVENANRRRIKCNHPPFAVGDIVYIGESTKSTESLVHVPLLVRRLKYQGGGWRVWFRDPHSSYREGRAWAHHLERTIQVSVTVSLPLLQEVRRLAVVDTLVDAPEKVVPLSFMVNELFDLYCDLWEEDPKAWFDNLRDTRREWKSSLRTGPERTLRVRFMEKTLHRALKMAAAAGMSLDAFLHVTLAHRIDVLICHTEPSPKLVPEKRHLKYPARLEEEVAEILSRQNVQTPVTTNEPLVSVGILDELRREAQDGEQAEPSVASSDVAESCA